MNSIEAMESEIASQPRELSSLRLPKPKRGALFVGAGDSYAAALAAQTASASKSLACNPLDLSRNPCQAKGRVVYLVSISGRTKQNKLAARAAKKVARHVVAITTNLDSPLARSCDAAIQLKFRSARVTTSGTVSFTACLLTCLSLAAEIAVPKTLHKILNGAKHQALRAAEVLNHASGSFFILAGGVHYPVALYGGLKLNEVIGTKTFAYNTEEFFHAPLFSANRNDGIVILGPESESCKNLAVKLRSAGFLFVHHAPITSKGAVAGMLHAAFFVQSLALGIARIRGQSECSFLQNAGLLKLSSETIYG